jgi:hypothetical protein
MISGEMFDLLEEMAREIRNNKKVFGGIQLVLSGYVDNEILLEILQCCQ